MESPRKWREERRKLGEKKRDDSDFLFRFTDGSHRGGGKEGEAV